jgi:hypothetical protein
MQLLAAPIAAQRRQSDAGGIEATIDGEHLPRNVACTIAAQKEYRLGQLFFQPVTIERNGVVIIGSDFRRVDGFGHRGLDWTWRHTVDADAE